MEIRPGTIDDIEGLAIVHVESWRTTYRGIVADSYLDGLTIEGRVNLWKQIIDPSNEGSYTFVIEDDQGKVAGFINGGGSREQDMGYDAEIYAFYLLQENQGKGYGRLLFNKMVETFKETGSKSMLLWVLEENPSVQFYKKMGGEIISRQELFIGDVPVMEISLGWKGI